MAQVKKRNRNEIRRALYAWIAWTPLLAVFVVMAIDTSFSLKARSADYEFGKLAARRRQITQELDRQCSAEAQWTDVHKVSEIIARLNMSLPDPEQIQVIIARPNMPMPPRQERPRDGALEMADGPAVTAGTAPAPAIPSAPAVILPVMAATPPAAPAVTPPVKSPETVLTPALAVASRPGGPPVPLSTLLDLPKEQITDLDSPDASSKDLMANL
jgi:cell division protein FtsL